MLMTPSSVIHKMKIDYCRRQLIRSWYGDWQWNSIHWNIVNMFWICYKRIVFLSKPCQFPSECGSSNNLLDINKLKMRRKTLFAEIWLRESSNIKKSTSRNKINTIKDRCINSAGNAANHCLNYELMLGVVIREHAGVVVLSFICLIAALGRTWYNVITWKKSARINSEP